MFKVMRSEVQRFRGSEVQRFRGSEVQRFRRLQLKFRAIGNSTK